MNYENVYKQYALITTQMQDGGMSEIDDFIRQNEERLILTLSRAMRSVGYVIQMASKFDVNSNPENFFGFMLGVSFSQDKMNGKEVPNIIHLVGEFMQECDHSSDGEYQKQLILNGMLKNLQHTKFLGELPEKISAQLDGKTLLPEHKRINMFIMGLCFGIALILATEESGFSTTIYEPYIKHLEKWNAKQRKD